MIKPPAGALRGAAHGTEGVLVAAAGGVAIAGLVLLATRDSMILTLGSLGVAGLIAFAAVFGAEKTGILLLLGGFFTAPFYKGTAPLGSPATGTDALLLAGFAFLLPQVLRGRVRLPIVYWIGVMLVAIAGMVASASSADPQASFLSLFFWMVVMVGLTCAFAAWLPSRTIIDLLAAAFVAGQIFSFGLGWARGNIAQNRHAGLASHFNYFGEAGMLALAVLIYLAYRYFGRSAIISAAIVAAVAVCGATVVLSGSRAATIVVAVLILMIPFVERSAITGFVWATLIALAVVSLPLLADRVSGVSSIDRLLGGGGSGFSNSARNLGLQDGVDLFFEHPLRGTGLITENLYTIHNNFLEVAVAIGIFGLAGYLLVLYAFARPLLGSGQLRRLCYPIWAYIGFGATVPSLYDRSIWSLVALSAVALVEYERMQKNRGALSGPPPRPTTVRPSSPVGVRPGADA